MDASNISGYGADGQLTATEIADVKQIAVNELEIKDLTGIGYFTALDLLACANNQLTSLDLSKNTALTMFACHNNQLTSLAGQ